MEQKDLQALVEEIRRLAELQMVECPDLHTEAGIPRHQRRGWTCILCHNTDQVPNPAFVPLLNVVRVGCPCLVYAETDGINHAFALGGCRRCYMSGSGNLGKGHEQDSSDCQCKGSNFITRNWEGTRPNALAGALAYAAGWASHQGDGETALAIIEWLKSLLPVHVPSTHVGPALPIDGPLESLQFAPEEPLDCGALLTLPPEIWLEVDYPFPPKSIRLMPGVIIRRILKGELADANL